MGQGYVIHFEAIEYAGMNAAIGEAIQASLGEAGLRQARATQVRSRTLLVEELAKRRKRILRKLGMG